MMWKYRLISTMVENHVHLPRMCAAKRLDVGEIVSSVLFYLTRDFRLDIIQYNTIHLKLNLMKLMKLFEI